MMTKPADTTNLKPLDEVKVTSPQTWITVPAGVTYTVIEHAFADDEFHPPGTYRTDADDHTTEGAGQHWIGGYVSAASHVDGLSRLVLDAGAGAITIELATATRVNVRPPWTGQG